MQIIEIQDRPANRAESEAILDLSHQVTKLQLVNSVLLEALEEIDGVGCDFGYYEAAAKTMKAITDRALDTVRAAL